MRLLCLVVVMLASVAHANPEADKLFKEGRALFSAGKIAEACDAFHRSNELAARVGTSLNVGNCEEKRGRFATAHGAFTQARVLAVAKKDKLATAEATKRLAALAAKVPHLTVRAPAVRPAGFVVKRAGTPVPSSDFDRELPIDPGSYELEASADGHVAWTQAIKIEVGQKAVIEIPALTAEPVARPVSALPPAPTQTASAAPIVDPEPATTLSASTVPRDLGNSRIGLGAAVGPNSDGRLAVGARLMVRVVDIDAKSAIRAVAAGYYWMLEPRAGQDQKLSILGYGVGGQYVRTIVPRLSVAAGLDVGIQRIDDSYQDSPDGQYFPTEKFVGVHVAPSFRLIGSLDVALHVRAVYSADSTIVVGEVGIDYFFW